MKPDKFEKLCFLALAFGSLLFGETPTVEPSNLVDKPDYDTTVTCSPCDKHQYVGLEPKDSFFLKDRRPAILENGIHYDGEEEVYVGGKSTFVPTKKDIIEDEVAVEEVK